MSTLKYFHEVRFLNCKSVYYDTFSIKKKLNNYYNLLRQTLTFLIGDKFIFNF